MQGSYRGGLTSTKDLDSARDGKNLNPSSVLELNNKSSVIYSIACLNLLVVNNEIESNAASLEIIINLKVGEQ